MRMLIYSELRASNTFWQKSTNSWTVVNGYWYWQGLVLLAVTTMNEYRSMNITITYGLEYQSTLLHGQLLDQQQTQLKTNRLHSILQLEILRQRTAPNYDEKGPAQCTLDLKLNSVDADCPSMTIYFTRVTEWTYQRLKVNITHRCI